MSLTFAARRILQRRLSFAFKRWIHVTTQSQKFDLKWSQSISRLSSFLCRCVYERTNVAFTVWKTFVDTGSNQREQRRRDVLERLLLARHSRDFGQACRNRYFYRWRHTAIKLSALLKLAKLRSDGQQMQLQSWNTNRKQSSAGKILLQNVRFRLKQELVYREKEVALNRLRVHMLHARLAKSSNRLSIMARHQANLYRQRKHNALARVLEHTYLRKLRVAVTRWGGYVMMDEITAQQRESRRCCMRMLVGRLTRSLLSQVMAQWVQGVNQAVHTDAIHQNQKMLTLKHVMLRYPMGAMSVPFMPLGSNDSTTLSVNALSASKPSPAPEFRTTFTSSIPARRLFGAGAGIPPVPLFDGGTAGVAERPRPQSTPLRTPVRSPTRSSARDPSQMQRDIQDASPFSSMIMSPIGGSSNKLILGQLLSGSKAYATASKAEHDASTAHMPKDHVKQTGVFGMYTKGRPLKRQERWSVWWHGSNGLVSHWLLDRTN